MKQLYLGLSDILANNIWSGASASIHSYYQELHLIETRTFGTIGNGFPRNFLDVRHSGRYLQVEISGTPSAWMNYATVLIAELSATLKSIGMNAKGLGYRA